MGADAWLYRLDDFTDAGMRLYGTSPHAVRVLQANFSFQVWDFLISFFHKVGWCKVEPRGLPALSFST